MDEVKRLRGEIDNIDEELVRLLKGRYEQARRLGRIKRTRGLELKDAQREEQILERVRSRASEMGLPQEPLRRIFLQVFNMAVLAQKPHPRMRQELKGLEVLVAGGTGGMGSLFASLAEDHGASARILGRTPARSRKVAREMGLLPGSFSHASRSDIVLVAVPIEQTLKVSLKLASTMKRESMLADISSVKSGIADNIDQNTRDFEYVSLHPLFGPDLSHIDGQHITAIPYRTGPIWEKVLGLFGEEGVHVHLTTAQGHDRLMAQIQGIHHFSLICLGMTLVGLKGDYVTRSLEITQRQIHRLIENWDTIVGIQKLNPYSASGRQALKRTVDKMSEMTPDKSEEARRLLTGLVQKWSRKQ